MSIDTKDHDGKTEFQKNIDGVTRVLAALPTGSRVSIFGITNDSFGRPYPLLTAHLSDEEGYFKERLARGRTEVIRAWRERAAQLQPQFTQTDLLDAMIIASQSFEQAPPAARKLLIVFSDMRQATAELDLERVAVNNTEALLNKVTHNSGEPDLNGVEVYALGVDAAGITYDRWRGIRTFWTEYFKKAGASAKAYSVLRDFRLGGIAPQFDRRDITEGDSYCGESCSKCIDNGGHRQIMKRRCFAPLSCLYQHSAKVCGSISQTSICDSISSTSMEKMQPDTLVRTWIVEVIRTHSALLAIAVRQRAKFEGWLKFELAAYAELQGAQTIEVETASGDDLTRTRCDLTFSYGAKRYNVELKTCNANWRMEGVLSRTRPITKNIAGIVADARKLKNCPGDGIVAFCMFPVACGDERWIEYLDRISNELGLVLSANQNAARVSIPVGSDCKADVVVVAFAMTKDPGRLLLSGMASE